MKEEKCVTGNLYVTKPALKTGTTGTTLKHSYFFLNKPEVAEDDNDDNPYVLV